MTVRLIWVVMLRFWVGGDMRVMFAGVMVVGGSVSIGLWFGRIACVVLLSSFISFLLLI